MFDYNTLAVLFAVAITIHNLEEAIWLPGWSENAGRWHKTVNAASFRFAVTVLTLFAYGVVAAAMVNGKQSVGAYLLAGYALAMCLNVFMPHLVATIALRKYAPGTLTALLFNLPVTFLILKLSIEQQDIILERFYIVGPIIVLSILVSIPFLFRLGNLLFSGQGNDSKAL